MAAFTCQKRKGSRAQRLGWKALHGKAALVHCQSTSAGCRGSLLSSSRCSWRCRLGPNPTTSTSSTHYAPKCFNTSKKKLLRIQSQVQLELLRHPPPLQPSGNRTAGAHRPGALPQGRRNALRRAGPGRCGSRPPHRARLPPAAGASPAPGPSSPPEPSAVRPLDPRGHRVLHHIQ